MKNKNIIIIGDFICGKSQILNRLEKNEFSYAHENKLYSFKKIFNIENNQILVNFFEAPSEQEKFEQFELKHFDGVIFVFDFGDKDSFIHIGNYFIHEVLESNKICNVFGILGNKCDIYELDREISLGEVKNYVNKLKIKLKNYFFLFDEVSAKLNIGIKEFFEKFIKLI